ncbi:MarR family winged helix-turn-helix transcriptional regulator [Actinomycetospora flava]|uniref:MarR family transcriptional regulator n=1 Tax=Actinomycetospora flava TaxID=3129232 RepID=A0ABU8MBR9_9PSEU
MTVSEPSHPAALRLVEMLDLADRAVEACLSRITTSEGRSREQWRALMLLDEGAATDGAEPAGHTMGEIAARAAVPPPTATRMIDKLVSDGLAFRRSDPWDRRRVLVHISPEGHALVTRAALDLDKVLGSVMTDLPAADRLDIRGLLERLGAAAGVLESPRSA